MKCCQNIHLDKSPEATSVCFLVDEPKKQRCFYKALVNNHNDNADNSSYYNLMLHTLDWIVSVI